MNLLKKEKIRKTYLEGIKIINPTKTLEDKLYKMIEKNVKSDKSGNIEIKDIDNPRILFFLFKELVKSENKDIDFNTMSIEEFAECLDEPSDLMHDMAIEIGLILGNIIEKKMKEFILVANESKIQYLSAVANRELEELNRVAREDEKKRKHKEDEERIKRIRVEKGFE